MKKLELDLKVTEDIELSHAVAYELAYADDDKSLAELLKGDNEIGANSRADSDDSGNRATSET